jgi:hypothetical protein
VEVRWRSLFRGTSLDNQYTPYNAPPTSWKRAADRWSLQNFLHRSSLFMVGKAQNTYGVRSELNFVFSLERLAQWNPIRTPVIQYEYVWNVEVHIHWNQYAKVTLWEEPLINLHKVLTPCITGHRSVWMEMLKRRPTWYVLPSYFWNFGTLGWIHLWIVRNRTEFTQQIRFWESDSRPADQEIPRLVHIAWH